MKLSELGSLLQVKKGSVTSAFCFLNFCIIVLVSNSSGPILQIMTKFKLSDLLKNLFKEK